MIEEVTLLLYLLGTIVLLLRGRKKSYIYKRGTTSFVSFFITFDGRNESHVIINLLQLEMILVNSLR